MTVELLGWAWWSKEPGSQNEIRVLAGSGDHDAAEEEIKRLHPGEPQWDAPVAPLPWAVFSSNADRTYTVCWWDWTGAHDGRNRRVFAVLYLRLASSSPLTCRYLADYARAQWQRQHADRAGTPVRPPAAPAAGAPDDLGNEADRRWAGAVAALTLETAVRIDVTTVAEPGPDWASDLFDAITALLPAATRETLSLTTGTVKSENGPFAIAIGKATGRQNAPVTLDEEPDLTDYPAARAYRDTLDRMDHQFYLADIVTHLARMKDVPERPGPAAARAATARLAAMDRLTAVGTALLQGQPVDDAQVLALVAADRLADRVPPDMHLAFVSHLLTRGGPAGLRHAAANWLPGATRQLVDVLAGATAHGPPDAEWLTAAVTGPVRAAGADNVLLPLLQRSKPGPPVAVLIGRAVSEGLGSARLRSWLLAPGHDDFAARVVRTDPEAVVPWLALADGAPPWVSLLQDAVDGSPRRSPSGVDPGWLPEAYEISRRRHEVRATLQTLLPDLVVAAVHDALGERLAERLAATSAADPADRATLDFLLLLAGPQAPPGLRPGSGSAADPAYANRLGRLGARHERFWAHLRTALAADATEEALVLLDHFRRTEVIGDATLVEHALAVVRARPELLDRPGADDLRKAVLDGDPGLHRTLLLREADRRSLTRAEPGPFAELLVRATRLRCDPGQLSISVNRWAATARPGQLHELVDAAGSAPGDGGDWQATLDGLTVVVPLLGADHHATLSRSLRSGLATETRALDEQIAGLVRRREVLAGVEDLLETPRGGKRRFWVAILRWLGLAADPAHGPARVQDHR